MSPSPGTALRFESQYLSEQESTSKTARGSHLSPHAALFADFVETGAGDNLDTFLTRVSTMPAVSQNKLLKEKLLLVNEKLVNVFEEVTNVQKFHDKLA